jgi:L-histidine Nalpha-methyltransferase
MLRELSTLPAIAAEVEDGLTTVPRSLPCKLFYDEAGSALFEEITRLPEYYLTRLEHQILCEQADGIAAAVGEEATVVELGAGSATKTCTLLSAFAARQKPVRYVPVDISQTALEEAGERVALQCPGVSFHPIAADFTEGLEYLREVRGPKLIAYLGSSIGNFDPNGRMRLLRAIRKQAAPGDWLLLGTDMAKDPAILLPAYDDSRGVTARFNKNILCHVNREFSADFNIALFRHVAVWNAEELCIEIYLESLRAQEVSVGLLHIALQLVEGERIHTENSFKFTLPIVGATLAEADFVPEKTWMDRREWYAVNLARV